MRPRIMEIAFLIAVVIAVVIATQAFPKRFKGVVITSTVTSGPIRDSTAGRCRSSCSGQPPYFHPTFVRPANIEVPPSIGVNR